MHKRVLLFLLSIVMLFPTAACHNSTEPTETGPDGNLIATTDDNIRTGQRLAREETKRFEVDHPLFGGIWINEDSGVTLEFSEDGYVNFDQRSMGGENNRYVYELYVDAVEVGINSDGVISEYWYYMIDGNTLGITWPDGSRTTFYRDGGIPSVDEPADEPEAVSGETPGSVPENPQSDISERDVIVSTHWFDEDMSQVLAFDDEYGILYHAPIDPSAAVSIYSYTFDGDTITASSDDGKTEQWSYKLDGDTLYITWPDGSTTVFYRP